LKYLNHITVSVLEQSLKCASRAVQEVAVVVNENFCVAKFKWLLVLIDRLDMKASESEMWNRLNSIQLASEFGILPLLKLSIQIHQTIE